MNRLSILVGSILLLVAGSPGAQVFEKTEIVTGLCEVRVNGQLIDTIDCNLDLKSESEFDAEPSQLILGSLFGVKTGINWDGSSFEGASVQSRFSAKVTGHRSEVLECNLLLHIYEETKPFGSSNWCPVDPGDVVAIAFVSEKPNQSTRRRPFANKSHEGICDVSVNGELRETITCRVKVIRNDAPQLGLDSLLLSINGVGVTGGINWDGTRFSGFNRLAGANIETTGTYEDGFAGTMEIDFKMANTAMWQDWNPISAGDTLSIKFAAALE